MKIKELKELLNSFDDNDIVIMAKDGEGNGFSPLSGMGEASYEAESDWSGIVGIRELTPNYIKAGYGEEDLVENGVNAVVLYPIN
jgi:hypothetical protein